MSNNQEYILTEHDLLMSYTDLKGVITSVNDNLLHITGYTKEELVGKSHSMLRHPDMPNQIYADLWRTIAKTHTWTGLVKNKTKSGGFYWVRASITPVYQKEKIIGYVAVHRNPDPETVSAIIPIYAQMRAGTFKGAVVGGSIVENDFLCRTKRHFADIKIKYKFLFLALFTSLSLFVFGGINYVNLNTLDNSYHNTIQTFKHVSTVMNTTRKSSSDFKLSIREWRNILLRGQNPSDFTAYKTAFENAYKNSITDLEQLKKLRSEYAESIDKIEHLIISRNQNFIIYSDALKQYQQNGGNLQLIDSMTKNVSDAEIAEFDFLMESLEKEVQNHILFAEVSSDELILSDKKYLSYALLFILTVILSVFWLVLQNIIKPLEYAKNVLKKISQGHYLQPVDTILQNEVGEMLDLMKAMSVRLGSVIDTERKAANDHLAALIGLDNVTTGVLITDTSRNIIYINRTANRFFKEHENSIRNDYPNFQANKVLGECIDIFHENPERQIAILQNLSETLNTNILVGGRNMHLAISPIINQFGHRLGEVIELHDETLRLNVEKEISTIVNDAINGRFNNRFEQHSDFSFYKLLTDDLNRLLEVCEVGFNDFKHIFSNMVKGDLTEKIERQYQGDFDILTQDANLAVLQLNTVVFDLNNAINKVNYNIQEINEGNNELANRTQSQTENVQLTVSAISELKTAVEQNDDAAKDANDAVKRVFDVANKGVKVIHNVVSTMQEIHTSSLKVGDIISVIDGIAFQTNILALNAAVEAARAGEQGRGFAVVASEVRNLAQMAAGAAKEIKSLITDSEEKIETGGEFVGNAGKIMQEIATSIESVTAMMATISAACSEQSLAIEQVSSAIMETENIAKQNAELVVQATNSSASLEEEMKILSEKTAYFKVQQNAVDFQMF
jgi:methyl-accepting chemotaxis protein